MELDNLLQKLRFIDFEKDSIYSTEQIVKEIGNLSPKDSIFINKILDMVESDEGEIFSRMILTCTLRDLYLSSNQIERIWKMIQDTKHYNSGFREYLMKALNGASLNNHADITKELYKRFKTRIHIEEKIQIAELLLNVDAVCDEISSWLVNFVCDDSLSSTIDNTNTIALKCDCCTALSSHKNYIKSAKKAMFHLLIQCKFLKYYDDRQWEIIKYNFLKMPIDKEDIYLILELAKDHKLISYHRIHILLLLKKVTLETDIVMSLIDMLVQEDESFEDFNMNILDILLKVKIMPEHIKKIRILQESDTVPNHTKSQLEDILNQLHYS